MSWIETQVPCMLYCGDDLCNCSARWFYEELEEDEDWSIADKKGYAVKRAYSRYLERLREYHSNVYPALGAALSKETSTLREKEIITA